MGENLKYIEEVSREHILLAAVWYHELELKNIEIPINIRNPKNCDHGVVFCGYRHPHCIYTMVAVTGKRSVTAEAGRETQGFLTSKNRFVDREEAAKIFVACGGKLKYSSTQLYSEDLY